MTAIAVFVALGFIGARSVRAYRFESVAPSLSDGVDDPVDCAAFVCSLPEEAKNRMALREAPLLGSSKALADPPRTQSPSVLRRTRFARSDSQALIRRVRDAAAPPASGKSPEAH